MNPTDVFEADDAGNIITKPMVGYSTMPVAGMFILARLEYANSDAHLKAVMSGQEKAGGVQLVITPDKARELAARLVFLADQIIEQQTPDMTNRN